GRRPGQARGSRAGDGVLSAGRPGRRAAAGHDRVRPHLLRGAVARRLPARPCGALRAHRVLVVTRREEGFLIPPARPRLAFARSGFFVLRTPLLPFAALPTTRAELQALLARPELRDALFVAAPSLDERLEVWRRDPDSEAGRKMEQALVRYAARM